MRGRKDFRCVAWMVICAFALPAAALAQPAKVRVATYNIEHFGGKPNGPNRIARLQDVISKLDADVIGLQEIKDVAVLRSVFPAAQWQLVIDDESNDSQDVAIAVRKPFKIVDESADDVNASDDDFLYPDDTNGSPTEKAFPNGRDGLFARIDVPNSPDDFILIVHHAKARAGGRDATDWRRELAARMIVEAIETRFDGELVVLLGDMNDNPDDASMNILETGDPAAVPGPDDVSDDTFLINLTQPLLALDRVSWGLRQSNITGTALTTSIPGSRDGNNATRGGSGDIAPILFDQILVSHPLFEKYVVKHVDVFSEAAAQVGHGFQTANAIDYASDHTPVIAEFSSEPATGPRTIPLPANTPPTIAAGVVTAPPVGGAVGVAVQRVRIAELLPNPNGPDAGNETITLKNFGPDDVDLTGWRLIDKSDNELKLTGAIEAGKTLVVKLKSSEVPLNNNGDEVRLLDDADAVVDVARYAASEVASGQSIKLTD